MKQRWLSIVGIGEQGMDALPARARTLIKEADVLVGGARHLAMLPGDDRPRLPWPRPLSALIPRIREYRGRPVCVLATGDPMHFGIGVTLSRHFSIGEMEIIPSPSAFALAAARLGWALADVETLTLHGRPAELVVPFIQPDRRLLILSDGSGTPSTVANLLCTRGYGKSRLTVLEHMGGTRERSISGVAEDWDDPGVAPFNTLAVECVAGTDAECLPLIPGLPDESFENDGNITKREIRAITLAALQPMPGRHLWDIGAGCGSVAIEWMRTHPLCCATAIEKRPERLALAARNAITLGVPNLRLVEGTAPEALADLDAPDAVFVGGGASGSDLLGACWQALSSGGVLVANVVTVESERALLEFCKGHPGSLGRISVARTRNIGSFSGWHPLMPVTQLVARKP